MTALAAGLLLVGCQAERPSSNPVVVALVTAFTDAEILLPTTEIDFGSPGARRHFMRGFHDMSRPMAEDNAASWTLADGAEVEFYVDHPRDLTMTFRCAPVPHEGEPLPSLRLEIGDRVVFEQQISRGMRQYEAKIPNTVLKRGANRLRIVHPRHVFDVRRKQKDTRVIWDWLRLDQEAPSPPRVDGDEKTLFMPSGSRVDYFLDLPPRARFESARIVPRSHDGPLRVRCLLYTSPSPRD